MKLIAISKNKKRVPRESEVISITTDGWVVTKDGAFGDNGQDCEIELEARSYLRKIRKDFEMSQLQMAQVLGVTRATYINYEKGKTDISLKQFLTLTYLIKDNEWAKMREKIINNKTTLAL
jgi:DNA-binding XRE family transcriptional regulator